MPETLEDVLRINPDTPMAIIRVEEWPPGEDITTIGDKSCCRQLIKDQVSFSASVRTTDYRSFPLLSSLRNISSSNPYPFSCNQDRSEDLGDANIVIAVTGWTEADEEESESNQKHVASVREQITCLADRIYLSLCSTGVNSCRKSKEKGGRRSLTLNNTSEPPSPSPVHASRAVILSAPEDPLGITCTHLVCPLRLTALSSKR